MTKEELATFDGQDGKAVYVAVNNVIYDVSSSSYWAEGDHVGAHKAGHDLTEELKSAPHVRTVVERFPVVGTLDKPAPEKKKKRFGLF